MRFLPPLVLHHVPFSPHRFAGSTAYSPSVRMLNMRRLNVHGPQAERAAAKRDAFLKKKGATGSGSASGGESEHSSSVPNTPRGDQSLADQSKLLVGGIVTVSEEETSTCEAVPQNVEVPQDVNGAAGGSGAVASHHHVARVPAVEGLSSSSAVETEVASPKGGALKRNSSQRRTGKTSSGISPR